MGTLVSAIGVVLSVKLDTPTGGTIVCTFGGVLILMFLVHLLVYHKRGKAEKPRLHGAGENAYGAEIK
jgi:hypothetical protein